MKSAAPTAATAVRAVFHHALGIVARGHAARVCGFVAVAVIGNLFELAHALERHDGYLKAFVPLTFVGNHDVTRIASRLKDERTCPPHHG